MTHQGRLRWFAREVLPHEADVRRWLVVRTRGLKGCDVDDMIQEAYARLWSADADGIKNPRAYLFVTVRHLVGEHLRRSRIVSIELMADVESLNVADGEISTYRRLSGEEEVARLQRVMSKLPPKCRRAFRLKKIEQLSQREVAKRMGISESTVEKHLVKALKFVLREMHAPPPSASETNDRVHRQGTGKA